MLPSSHPEPINALNAFVADHEIEGRARAKLDGLQNLETCPRQRDSRDESEIQATSALILAGEFSEFIAAASRLENSYRALQVEVSELGLELSERNAALNNSLAANEQMRLALEQIVDSMPCGVVVLERDGGISMINPESKRMLGLDRAPFVEGSKTTLQQISACSGINLEASYKDKSSVDTEQEFCVRNATGKRWLEVRNRRLFHQSCRTGMPNQTILILRDITSQKRSEQEREAGRKAMALAEVSTILAHEIRNPLASLELFAELIEKDGDRRKEWVSNLRAGIRSLSGTVNNVLSFHGSGTLKLVPIQLSALIGNAVRFVQPLAAQASVSLECSVDHEPMLVMGNDSAIQQVVLNLISNALRYTSTGGVVTLSLRYEPSAAKGEYAIVVVSDTGCGIRPDQISHIFEPGFSGTGDTSGLGLAVCERIMKQHGGTISVSNGILSGARFTLLFPVLRNELATV